MSLLAGILGALLTFAVVLGLLRLRPALARVLGALGWLALVGLALWPVLVQEQDEILIGFSILFLGLGLLAGLLCAAPRRVRWPREAVWVSWGVGLLAALALVLGGVGLNAGLVRGLPPEQRGAVTSGIVAGLLLSLLPALAVAALVARRPQKAEAVSPTPESPEN